MNPILVFICRSLDEYRAISLQDSAYDRYYITDGFEVNYSEENSSYMSISLENEINPEFIIRLVFLFSNPFYDVVCFSETNLYDHNTIKKILHDFSGCEIVNDLLVVSREHVAMNGFEFKLQPKKIEHKDPILLAEKLSMAMSEIPVENEYFKNAIEELIPSVFYEFDESVDTNEIEILNIFKNKNVFVEYKDRKMSVYWKDYKVNNPAIVFSKEQLQDYTFKVLRTDGLNFYLYM